LANFSDEVTEGVCFDWEMQWHLREKKHAHWESKIVFEAIASSPQLKTS